jgi:hypothetical protein
VPGFVRRLWEYILDKEDKNMMLDIGKVKKIGLFASGVLFGTAGVKVLGSKDAKKFYINCLAAGLRAKDCVMKTVNTVQENAEDILAEAKSINEEREAKAEAAKVSDASEDVCECAKADEQEAEQTEVTAETAEAVI